MTLTDLSAAKMCTRTHAAICSLTFLYSAKKISRSASVESNHRVFASATASARNLAEHHQSAEPVRVRTISDSPHASTTLCRCHAFDAVLQLKSFVKLDGLNGVKSGRMSPKGISCVSVFSARATSQHRPHGRGRC
jgi:hypothetical protein